MAVREADERVYNAHVADWHTFAVGELGVLVHNSRKPPQAPKPATATEPLANIPKEVAGDAKKKQVTSWAEAGKKPDLAPGRWVQLGKPTWWNYLKTGLWGGKFGLFKEFPWIWKPSNVPFSNYITGFLEQSQLMWPRGWEVIKVVLGQRLVT